MTTENQNDTWTEPEHLPKMDHNDLKYIRQLYLQRQYKEALNYASQLDSALREEIPPNIWRDMGGELTRMGQLKLQAMNRNKNIGGREL